MKTVSKISAATMWSILVFSLFMAMPLKAQDSESAAEETDTEIIEDEKISPDVKLQYFNRGDGNYMFRVTLNYREGREIIPLTGVLINVYLNEVTKAGMMGSLNTNKQGVAEFPLVNKFKEALDTLTTFKLIAKIQNDRQVEDGLHEQELKKASLTMEPIEDEGGRRIKLALRSTEDGEEIPVIETDLIVFVKRSFSLLPISGDYCSTDDDGNAEIEFPENLPGNERGELRLIARLDNHDEYGTLEFPLMVNWGTTVVPSEHMEKALWGSRANAPMWLLILTNGIIFGVWLVIIYIIIEIRRIHIIGKT